MNSPNFVGHLDGVQDGDIYGWALDRSSPSEPVMVSIYLNHVFATQVLAGYYRPDVEQALQCAGSNGFYVHVDSLCARPGIVQVDVRFPDGSSLIGSPVEYKVCPIPKHTDPTLLFMHIPKTAGTSFREAVLPNFKQSEVAYIYGHPPGFPSACIRDIPLPQRSRLRLVFGHYGYGIHCDMPNECDYAALIRDPLERIWSHYLHLVRHKDSSVIRGDRPMRIEEVMEARQSVHLDNLYVRYFCGVEESVIPPGSINRDLYQAASANIRKPNVFLGFQTDLESAYDSLAGKRGWKRGVRCPRVNLSPLKIPPTAREAAAIRHFNSWSFKLYDDIRNAG